MKRVLCVALLCAFAINPAHADKCALPLVASLDLTPLPNGAYSIPLSINGVERKFELGRYTNVASRELISEAAGNPWYHSTTIEAERVSV